MCRADFTGAWGIPSFFMGELTIARERFEQSLALYRPEMHNSQIAQYGTDLFDFVSDLIRLALCV